VVGKKQPRLKITKGKLGTKTKKKDLDEDDAARAAREKQGLAREIRGMEEMHWTIAFEKLEEIAEIRTRLNAGQVNMLDIIYEPFELFTDVRKRNQIELIKGVIF